MKLKVGDIIEYVVNEEYIAIAKILDIEKSGRINIELYYMGDSQPLKSWDRVIDIEHGRYVVLSTQEKWLTTILAGRYDPD